MTTCCALPTLANCCTSSGAGGGGAGFGGGGFGVGLAATAVGVGLLDGDGLAVVEAAGAELVATDRVGIATELGSSTADDGAAVGDDARPGGVADVWLPPQAEVTVTAAAAAAKSARRTASGFIGLNLQAVDLFAASRRRRSGRRVRLLRG